MFPQVFKVDRIKQVRQENLAIYRCDIIGER